MTLLIMEHVASYDNIRDTHAQLTRSEEDYTRMTHTHAGWVNKRAHQMLREVIGHDDAFSPLTGWAHNWVISSVTFWKMFRCYK